VPVARGIYDACKRIDGMPDARGSTVHAGARVMLARRRIGTYFWAHDVDEALAYVGSQGPVVFGTAWSEGMCRPSTFNATIKATGKIVGGHAYLVCGVQWGRKRARIHQSWGTDWGDHGECWISISDLRAVFDEGGEACAATERPLAIGGGT
jgi:hypothetical protein